MGWADNWIEKLREGETVSFRPRGNSMSPKIESGDLVTVSPIGDHVVQEGDVVLCKVKGSQYLHLVKAVQDGRYQIGNNRGGTNGWIGKNGLYGILVSVERQK